jgi:hypothetical protein
MNWTGGRGTLESEIEGLEVRSETDAGSESVGLEFETWKCETEVVEGAFEL